MSGAGAIESSVTLDEVFTVLVAKRVPLAPELAGYLVLEIAEHADPNGGDVDPRAVIVGEEGTVALVKRRDAAAGDAEASVRSVLARLLDVTGAQTPALSAASRRKSGSGLAALTAELETALIPVNRAAGRRALARLAREVRRILLGVGRNALPSTSDATTSPRRSIPPASADPSRASSAGFGQEEPTTTRRPAPGEVAAPGANVAWTDAPTTQFESPARSLSSSNADVDALIDQFAITAEGDQEQASALKAMAGLEPTPPPPPPQALASLTTRVGTRGAGGADEDAEVESLLAMTGGITSRPPPPREIREARGRVAEARQLPTQPSRRQRPSLPSMPVIAPPRRSIVPVLVAIAAVAGGGYAAWALRPGAATRSAPSADMAVADVPVTSAASRPAPACVGALVITNVPAHAEVLFREGQAPVDVEKMPVGARLEFVATAEGFAPKRVVVPQGTTWDPGPDGKPRYEAAVQLDKSTSKTGLDAWPSGEPGSEVGGQGPPGTVHVVATPRGAEVWMLTGIGPEARVEQIRCDRDVDVLIAGPTTYRKRLHVGSSAFVAEEGAAGASKAPARVARISAK